MSDRSPLTPPQTIGPYFHIAFPRPGAADLTGMAPIGARTDLSQVKDDCLSGPSDRPLIGTRLAFSGRIVDVAGNPVPEGLVETWQVGACDMPDDAESEGFLGFGRCATDDDGRFEFLTMMPAALPGQAPHIALSIFAPGLPDRLVTRAYFDGDPRNDQDPVLGSIPALRRKTLLARPTGDGSWFFPIVMRGKDETVFFELV